MSKLEYDVKTVINMVASKVCSIRFLTIFLILFLFHDIYIRDLPSIAEYYHYNIVPLMFPFLLRCPDFLLIYALGIIYFFSDVPFMNRWEMPYVIRMGRIKWGIMKVISLLIESGIYVGMNYMIDIIRLFPHISFDNKWDKIIFSLANGTIEMEINIFTEDIVNYHSPLQTCIYSFGIGTLVTFMTAICLFAVSLMVNRKTAVVFGIVLSVIPFIAKVVYPWIKYIYFVSPFNWIGNFYPQYVYRVPDMGYKMVFIVIGVAIGCITIFGRLKSIDYNWIEED